MFEHRMGCPGDGDRCCYERAIRCRSRRGNTIYRKLPMIGSITMFYLRKSTLLALSVMLGAFMVPTGVQADDIDIFLGSSAGSSDSPNIIFLIYNSPNWSRASQHWPDNGGNQGQAELTAVSSTLSKINSTRPANVGLAMLTAYSGTGTGGATPGTGGGYIRFGVRDMTN